MDEQEWSEMLQFVQRINDWFERWMPDFIRKFDELANAIAAIPTEQLPPELRDAQAEVRQYAEARRAQEEA